MELPVADERIADACEAAAESRELHVLLLQGPVGEKLRHAGREFVLSVSEASRYVVGHLDEMLATNLCQKRGPAQKLSIPACTFPQFTGIQEARADRPVGSRLFPSSRIRGSDRFLQSRPARSLRCRSSRMSIGHLCGPPQSPRPLDIFHREPSALIPPT